MDHKKIEKAVQLFLEGIGEDCTREGLAETPKRIANMCEQLFGGYEQDARKTFVTYISCGYRKHGSGKRYYILFGV